MAERWGSRDIPEMSMSPVPARVMTGKVGRSRYLTRAFQIHVPGTLGVSDSHTPNAILRYP